jgi:hypothetical protein
LAAHVRLGVKNGGVTPKGTKLYRPSEAVLDLLDHPAGLFVKEDGEKVTFVAGDGM